MIMFLYRVFSYLISQIALSDYSKINSFPFGYGCFEVMNIYVSAHYKKQNCFIVVVFIPRK